MRRAATIAVLLAVATSTVACSGSVVQNVNEAMNLSPGDPVIAFLVLRDIRSQEKLTPDQNVQVDQQMASLRPRALAILQRDFKVAADGQDLRGMTIVARLAHLIAKDNIEGEPAISETKNRLLSGAEDRAAIWRVNATATLVKGFHTSHIGDYKLDVRPAEGFELLRVKARVENVSAESDKTYALWAPWIDVTVGPKGDFKTRLERAREGTVPATEPHRWLHPTDIYVVTPSSDLLPLLVAEPGRVCGPVTAIATDRGKAGSIIHIDLLGDIYVVTPSPDLRPLVAAKPGTRKLCPPKAITRGGSIDTEMLFSVPKGVEDLRILILGAAPVRLNKLP